MSGFWVGRTRVCRHKYICGVSWCWHCIAAWRDSGFHLEVIAVYLKKMDEAFNTPFATHTVLDNLPTRFICACLLVGQSVCLSVYSLFIGFSPSLPAHQLFHVLSFGPKSHAILVPKNTPLKIFILGQYGKTLKKTFLGTVIILQGKGLVLGVI